MARVAVSVRPAAAGDQAAVAAAVEALLAELGGRRPQRAAIEAEVAALIGGGDGGAAPVGRGVASAAPVGGAGAAPAPDGGAAPVGSQDSGEDAGELLVAEAEGAIVGVLAASWQRAIHVPGPYATIQDLWVDPGWRSRGVGAELLAALAARARARGVARLEVGLPREHFAALERTEAFYRGAGFEHLGPRMRLLLDPDRGCPLSADGGQRTTTPAGEGR